MAAPTYFGAGAAIANAASVDAAWPASHEVNDLGILLIETGGEGTTLNPAGGWAHVTGSPATDIADATGSKFHVLWKRATSTTEANVTTGDSGDHQAAQIHVFRGVVADGLPWNVIANSTHAASLTCTWPTVTTTVDNCLIALAASRPDDAAGTGHWSTFANAALTGLPVAGASSIETGSSAGHGGGAVMGSGVKATAGVVGATTATKTVSTTGVVFTIALRPPSDPPYRNPMPPLIAQ